MRSHLGWIIIKRFASKNMHGFTLQDVACEFPDWNRNYLANLLAKMVELGMLCKISWNIYHIIPLEADPQTYTPDNYQVAKYMTQNKEYYIGYGSAMKIHGLTLQSRSSEYVVTKTQIKPAIRSLRGITVQVIKHNAIRFFGYTSIWINKCEKAMVSDLEKTIVDASEKPEYCGGIIEVGNAIVRAKDRIEYDKLFYYFSRNRNKSAKKRFLFLANLLGLEWTADHERMLEELGSGISLLDPEAPDQGPGTSKFRLKVNVDPVLIKQKVLEPQF